MDKNLTDTISEDMLENVPGIREDEVRRALAHLTTRWHMLLTENEKWALARKLGGNRYANLTMEVLDSIMKQLLEDWKHQ